MAYVITASCIDVKDLSCLTSCPVDCIYQGGRTVYIQPDECINCGLCETVCPVDAIYSDERLPESMQEFVAINAEFFGPNVTGWNSPRGADAQYKTKLDHPRVAAWPRKSDL
jgi:NAD-dependent dihydropyrimidine dehydrogenase PreA subunit